MDLFLHRWSDSNWDQIGREQLDSLDPCASMSAIYASRGFTHRLLRDFEDEGLHPAFLEEFYLPPLSSSLIESNR